MRFASVPLPKSEPQRSPAAEFVLNLLAGKPVTAQPAPPQAEAPPVDLDQRVRLLGEW